MKRTRVKKTTEKVGQEVLLKGWVDSIREHGSVLFIDLRDVSGLVQVVFSDEALKDAEKVGSEWVVEIRGEVKKRPESMINEDIETGTVEISGLEISVLSEAETPPIPIDTDGYKIEEKKRLDYRYLDLRRQRMKRNIILRQEMTTIMREFLVERGFLEIETPILTKSTPEGARDFIVPSRLHSGEFYALPQSPQQYKQLLMVAGFERYFQLARCFRDEDPRSDRAYGEFTQLDMELSFTSQEEILELVEEMYVKIVEEIFPEKTIKEIPFPRLSYDEVMEKHGTDKPDLREDRDDPDELAFAFIVDWPLFEKTSDRNIGSMHHPFTAPKDPEDLSMNGKSWQHDFVLNGFEIGGGSIRITDPEVQEKIFSILGHTEEEIETKFGHLLEAFKYGVPPHGGIAPGLDRSLMAILGEKSVREVMAFPTTASGTTAVMNAPSKVSEEQLEELNIKVKDE